MPLEPIGSYDTINGGAHRKAASIVGAPSLIRHVALWDVADDLSPDEVCECERTETNWARLSKSAQKEIARKVAYNKYVETLRDWIAAKNNSECWISEIYPPRTEKAADDGSAVNIVRFFWRGLYTFIRVEFHSEYITISSVIDCSVKRREHNKKKSSSHIGLDIANKMENLANNFNRNSLSQSSSDISFLQHDALLHLENEVWNRGSGKTCPQIGTRMGKVFGDFRGILTGSASVGAGTEILHSFSKIFEANVPRQRRESIGTVREWPSTSWTRPMLDRLWPLIEPTPLSHHEFSISRFLDGNVLFVTAGGPAPGEDSPQLEGGNSPRRPRWQPVYYFIHSFTDDAWQLGRLVDRINTMGTLRLATTIDVDGLRAAAHTIEELSDDIEDATNQIAAEMRLSLDHQPIAQSEANQEADVEGAHSPLSEERSADGWVSYIQERLNGINSKEVSGDIIYRLGRAQYYVERFNIESQALRIKRIEGFQPYDEYVTRRMSPLFEFIRLLKGLMDDIYGDQSRLLSHYSSLKIAQAAQRIRDHQAEIRKIQDFGEVALILFLIPYYLGTVLFEHVFHIEKLFEKQDIWIPRLWLFLIIIPAVSVLLWKRRRKDVLKQPWRKRVGSISAFAALLLSAILAAHVVVFEMPHGTFRWMGDLVRVVAATAVQSENRSHSKPAPSEP